MSTITTSSTATNSPIIAPLNVAIPPPLPSLSKHSIAVANDTTAILTALQNDTVMVGEIEKLQSSADQTQRQLILLNDHVDKSLETLDELEIATLPLFVSRCHDLERIYSNIDQLYALVKEIEYGFDLMEARCDAIEKAQGSSASIRKNMGMFFRSMFDADLKQTKVPMPANADIEAKAVPSFGTYINKNYVPVEQVKKYLQEEERKKNVPQQTTPTTTPQAPPQEQITIAASELSSSPSSHAPPSQQQQQQQQQQIQPLTSSTTPPPKSSTPDPNQHPIQSTPDTPSSSSQENQSKSPPSGEANEQDEVVQGEEEEYIEEDYIEEDVEYVDENGEEPED